MSFFPSIFSALFVWRVRRTFFPSGWCFFYLVTTGWVFDISLCENSINQKLSIDQCFHQPRKSWEDVLSLKQNSRYRKTLNQWIVTPIGQIQEHKKCLIIVSRIWNRLALSRKSRVNGDRPNVLSQKLTDHHVSVSTTGLLLTSSLFARHGLCPTLSLISTQWVVRMSSQCATYRALAGKYP